jgi:hypothetical protein
MENFHGNDLNISIIERLFKLYQTTYQYLKSFPKKERYALGEKLENTILELLQDTFYLNQLPNALKENPLLQLNAKNETLKILFRLAHELTILDDQKYLNIQSKLQEIGRMIGGWIKFIKSLR